MDKGFKGIDKDIRKVLQDLVKQGYEIRISGKGYPMVYLDGTFVTKAAQTPSDRRGYKNMMATLRRSGYQPGGRKGSA